MPDVKTIIFLVTLLGAAVATFAYSDSESREDAAKGRLGDPAAALEIATWIHGDSVDLEEGQGEKIYLVEFWATWCPQCLKVSPKLSKLQETYRDAGLSVVAVTMEEPDAVQAYVDEKGDSIAYTIGIDKEQRTTRAYMAKFGLRGIPAAFLVDKEGKIAWVGHPADPVLEQRLRAMLERHDKKTEGES